VAELARAGVNFSLDQLDLFVHGRVVDTARLVREFRFTPRSTAAAFDDFLAGTGAGGILPREAVALAEQGLLRVIRASRSALWDRA